MKNERWYHNLAPKVAIFSILGFAALYDTICKPENMISYQVDRWRESDRTGNVTNLALDALYHHFKRDIPPEEDKIHRLATLFDRD